MNLQGVVCTEHFQFRKGGGRGPESFRSSAFMYCTVSWASTMAVLRVCKLECAMYCFVLRTGERESEWVVCLSSIKGKRWLSSLRKASSTYQPVLEQQPSPGGAMRSTPVTISSARIMMMMTTKRRRTPWSLKTPSSSLMMSHSCKRENRKK